LAVARKPKILFGIRDILKYSNKNVRKIGVNCKND